MEKRSLGWGHCASCWDQTRDQGLTWPWRYRHVYTHINTLHRHSYMNNMSTPFLCRVSQTTSFKLTDKVFVLKYFLYFTCQKKKIFLPSYKAHLYKALTPPEIKGHMNIVWIKPIQTGDKKQTGQPWDYPHVLDNSFHNLDCLSKDKINVERFLFFILQKHSWTLNKSILKRST